jgi:hypothetical protein
MTMMIAARILCVLMVSAPVVLPLQPPQAHAHEQTAPVRRAPTSEQQQEKMNAWTVGLIEGAPPLRLAAEKALVVVDEANLLVLPVVTLGTTEKLYLRGADLAIINSSACSLLAQAERLECLEKLSRDTAPPPQPAVSPSPD